MSACGLLGGFAHVPLNLWVHAYFYSVIYNERWELISFGDICVPACHYIFGYTLTIPPHHTLPYYPQTQYPLCPLCQTMTIWREFPPLDHGRAVAKPTAVLTLFVFVLAATCTMLRQDLTPGLALTQHNTLAHNHTSFPPPSVLHPPYTHTFQRIIFCKYIGPRLCVRFFVNGARSMGLFHIYTVHSINTRKHPTPTRLGRVYKRVLVVPPVSPHQREFFHGACIGTGVSFLFRSTLQTV